MAELSRRGFVIKTGAGALAGASFLAGCDLLSTKPSEGAKGESPAGSAAGGGKEAPALAAMVKAGTLPALQDRLPENPKVLTPVDSPGRYGGTINSAALGQADSGWMDCMVIAQDNIVCWDLEWNEVQPNVAESVEYTDGRVYTFTLREGTKWSDGEPFTTDDIIFWYEDIFSNKELTPAPDSALVAGGKPVVIRKSGERSVEFVFTAPNGLLLPWLAAYYSSFQLVPAHYLKKFHKKYNPDADTLAKGEGFSDWSKLFLNKLDFWANPEMPRLHAWVPKNAFGQGSRVVCERNPYYFKVDSDGRQLPYADRISFDVISAPETLTLKAQSGEIDIYFRYVNTPANKPVFAANRASGRYHFIEIKSPFLNTITLHLNLTHKDPVKRQIFSNKDFRIGLSYAMDRKDLISTVFQRQGKPWQAAPRPEAPFSDEEMGTQYTEFDTDLANEHLDRAGFDRRDSRGMRLGPDGQPIRFSILSQTRYIEQVDALQLIRKYWLDVGIDMQPMNIDANLWNVRVEAGEHDGCVDDGSPGYKEMIIDPRWLFANEAGYRYAPLWANWFMGVKPNEAPPAAMREQMRIWREEVQTSPDPESQYAGMKKLVEIAKQEFWIMGISLPPSTYGIVTDRLQNVPKSMWDLGRFPSPAPSNPAQYFIST
ncbi:ABC transporter substrate-binding protein [Actinopolymorpha pittospori]